MSATRTTIEAALATSAEYRAGGTDLQQRLRSGVATGPVVDLARLPGIDGIEWDDEGRARIGALVPMAALASDPRLAAGYPGLAAAAGAAATPQIRAVGTLGGNLLQRNRCWYFRHPATSCFKKGGDDCPAREGNHLYGVAFDLGPCVAPHPSTLGMALLAYEAEAEVAGGDRRPVAALYGDGSDGRRYHQLGPAEILSAVRMRPPLAGEQAAYFRSIGRALAEWPLVEAIVRLGVADEEITFARVAVGGVAPIPLRLEHVEAALVGRPAGEGTFGHAASLAAQGARPLPMTRYKVDLLPPPVHETLARALARRQDPPAV